MIVICILNQATPTVQIQFIAFSLVEFRMWQGMQESTLEILPSKFVLRENQKELRSCFSSAGISKCTLSNTQLSLLRELKIHVAQP